MPPQPTPLLRVFVAGNPISANHMYNARGYGAARRLTAEAVAWRDAVAVAAMPWRFAESAARPTLGISCRFIAARADVDNLLKLVVDGVKLGLAVDDRYVTRVCAEKVRGTIAERGAWIEVTQLPDMKPARSTQPQRRRAQPTAKAAAKSTERSA